MQTVTVDLASYQRESARIVAMEKRIAELEAALTNAIDLLEQSSFRTVPGSDDERHDYDKTVAQGRAALRKEN